MLVRFQIPYSFTIAQFSYLPTNVLSQLTFTQIVPFPPEILRAVRPAQWAQVADPIWSLSGEELVQFMNASQTNFLAPRKWGFSVDDPSQVKPLVKKVLALPAAELSGAFSFRFNVSHLKKTDQITWLHYLFADCNDFGIGKATLALVPEIYNSRQSPFSGMRSECFSISFQTPDVFRAVSAMAMMQFTSEVISDLPAHFLPGISSAQFFQMSHDGLRNLQPATISALDADTLNSLPATVVSFWKCPQARAINQTLVAGLRKENLDKYSYLLIELKACLSACDLWGQDPNSLPAGVFIGIGVGAGVVFIGVILFALYIRRRDRIPEQRPLIQ